MPIDTTRVISTRRTQKQISEEEIKDIELKRLRGELSCAECRRLKLKCDKKVPCGSCVRRGCESICPCGILSAGQGTRFILADTDQLHRKISEMSTRIRQLEDALAILQASVSDERHPLLNDDLLKVKFGGEALDHKPSETPTETSTKEAIDALGTLALGEDGNATYFGRSAGSETLMLAEADEDEECENGEGDSIELHPEIDHLSSALQILPTRRPNVASLQILESFLPDRTKALSLCDLYLKHATFFFRPIKSDELHDTLLTLIYDTAAGRAQRRMSAHSPMNPLEIDDSVYPHALASLFFVFALGSLLDHNLPPYNSQGEHFYHLGRAALSLRKTCPPSLETVQAAGLMATYHSLGGKKYTRDSAWCIMSLAAKLAQSYGLHRDSARWNLDPETVQRRRNLFWEVFSADVSHSLAMGRPPAIHLAYVDCEYPEDKEATLSDSGEVQSGFWKLKHDYARDIFYSVAEATLIAQAPNYKTILDLDRKVREMSYPSSLKPYLSPADGEDLYYSTSLSVRDFYASQNRTVTMIYLHRSFFAQAMLDHPTNPLQSPFAPSFLTAYRCASIIIKATAHQFDRCEALAKRLWFLLYHTFSAAVIVGTIVARCPSSSMASNALKDLDMAVVLFQKAAPQSQRARIALTVLKRLQDKASKAFDANAAGGGSPISPQIDPESEALEDVDLAIFGGQARVLNKKPKQRAAERRSSPASTSSPGEDAWAGLSPTAQHPVPQIAAPRPPPRRSPAGDFSHRSPYPQYAQPYSMETSRPEPEPHISPRAEAQYNQFLAMLGTTSKGHITASHSSTQATQHQPGASHLVNQPTAWDNPWSAWDPIPNASFLPTIGQRSERWSAHEPHASGSRGGFGLHAPRPSHPSGGVGPGFQPYDVNENAALLASFGLMSPVAEGSSSAAPGPPPPGARQGSHPGAVELGLSGESRLDSNWLAFMKDCGILGSSESSMIP